MPCCSNKLCRRCSDLEVGEPVVFNLWSNIYKRKIPFDGTVVAVYPKQREVAVSYLLGYRGECDNIPYEDMIAVYNKYGKIMQFENIVGKSDLLIAE